MVLLALIGTTSLIIASVVIGGRLAWRGRRDLASPEFLWGATYLTGGLIAFPFSIAAFSPEVPPNLRVTLGIVGQLGSFASISLFAIFVWQVFRRDSTWARLAVGAVIAVSVLLAAVQHFTLGFSAFFLEGSGVYRWSILVIVAGHGWGAAEALNHHSMLSRRLKLGLAEPVIVNRFLLWGLAEAASTLSSLAAAVSIAIFGNAPYGNPVFAGAVGAVGFITGVCLWLAFLPPPVYTQWIASRRTA